MDLQWMTIAALLAFGLSRALSADVPPVAVKLPKPWRLAISGACAAIGYTLSAHAAGMVWPAAIAQGLAAAAGAWGLDLAVPEGAKPAMTLLTTIEHEAAPLVPQPGAPTDIVHATSTLVPSPAPAGEKAPS